MTLALPLLFAALTVVPLARIFWRAGFSPWWAALVFVPDVGLTFALLALVARPWRVRA